MPCRSPFTRYALSSGTYASQSRLVCQPGFLWRTSDTGRPAASDRVIRTHFPSCFLSFTAGKAGGSAKINYSEARIVAGLAAQIYESHRTDFDDSRTLGVITPYRSQIALIKKEIEALGIPALNRILVDTVERFQGSERDVIIYSCCINSYYQLKFVSNLTEENGVLIDRKLNVALTRARKQMFVTGVPKYLKSNPLYESLLNLIETQG